MNIVTVGIDLAKNVFDLHGVDQSGKAVLIKPKVVRGQLLEMVAHYWAREFSRFGHTVKLMAPKFVAPSSTARRYACSENNWLRSTPVPTTP